MNAIEPVLLVLQAKRLNRLSRLLRRFLFQSQFSKGFSATAIACAEGGQKSWKDCGLEGIRQIVAALKECCSSKDLQRGREIHQKLGSEGGIFVLTALVDMYGKCGSMSEARRVFDKMSCRDVVAWNAIITGYAHVGAAGEALELYQQMQEDGFFPNGRTFVAVLSASTSLASKDDLQRSVNLGTLSRGVCIHAQVVRYGHEEDPFVANTLVDMYAKCRCTTHSRRVFDSIQSPNAVSWTAVILGCAHNGESETALELFATMREQGLKPDARTFVAALIACSGLASKQEGNQIDGKAVALEKGRYIHFLLQENDHRQQLNVVVWSCLVDTYAKCGSMPEARAVFERTSQHDVVAWNSIISGYTRNGDAQQAFEMFKAMQDRGVEPDSRTFVAAIGACSGLAGAEEAQEVNGKAVKVVAIERGRALHSQLTKLGYGADMYVENSLLDMYTKCGSLAEARQVFEGMRQRSVVSWTTMMLGSVQNGESELALELFTAMRDRDGLVPEARTYVAALNACSSLASTEGKTQGQVSQSGKTLKLKTLARGRMIHRELKNKGLEQDLFVANSLVDMYINCESIIEARSVFDSMRSGWSVAMWTSMIFGYVECGENETALEMFKRMQRHLVIPDARTFVAALKACGNSAAFDTGRYIHEQIRERSPLDHQSELIVANALITFYGKCGCVQEAQEVFHSIPSKRRNLQTWSSIISAYSQQGNASQVFSLFEAMQLEKISPDGVTFLSVLNACNHAGLVEEAKTHFQALLENYRHSATIHHYSCMIDLLGRANRLDEALAVLTSMPMEPDSTIWTSLLKWGNSQIGGEAFKSIQRLEVEEDDYCAASVLFAQSYALPAFIH